MNPLCTPADHRLTRRQWLGATALGAITSPAVAEELKSKEKQVLFVWLDGGMSQLESWDPKPNTTFGGPFRAIPTSVPGIHISELLAKTSKQMHHLAVLRSVCTQDNSHSAGVDRVQRGDPKNRGVTYPFFGSAIAILAAGNLGYMMAHGFVAAGARVYISSRKPEVCDAAAAELGKLGTCVSLPADLGNHDRDHQ